MSVYRILSERSTFFALDDNDNGHLDKHEAVFLDADHNQRLTGPDILVSQEVLTEALAPYGVRHIRRLNLPSLEKYTASFRKLREYEAAQTLDRYWQHYAYLTETGLAAGLTRKDLGSVLPTISKVTSDYHAAYESTLYSVCSVITSGYAGDASQYAISAVLEMMQEAETSRRTLGIRQAVFTQHDWHMLYRRVAEAYHQGAGAVRTNLLGLDASLSYQADAELGEAAKILRESSYDAKMGKVSNFLLLRHFEAAYQGLADGTPQSSTADLGVTMAPLAHTIIKEFVDVGELEAAALVWKTYATAPKLTSVDWSADGLIVQKAIADGAIAALKAGDQVTYQGLMTLLQEPLEGLLPATQAQHAFARIAFYQSVLAADEAGLASIEQLPMVDQEAGRLLSPEEASELAEIVQQPGIKAQLRAAFPFPQKKSEAEGEVRHRAHGITVEP